MGPQTLQLLREGRPCHDLIIGDAQRGGFPGSPPQILGGHELFGQALAGQSAPRQANRPAGRSAGRPAGTGCHPSSPPACPATRSPHAPTAGFAASRGPSKSWTGGMTKTQHGVDAIILKIKNS